MKASKPGGKLRTRKPPEKVQMSFLAYLFRALELIRLASHYINDYLYQKGI